MRPIRQEVERPRLRPTIDVFIAIVGAAIAWMLVVFIAMVCMVCLFGGCVSSGVDRQPDSVEVLERVNDEVCEVGW